MKLVYKSGTGKRIYKVFEHDIEGYTFRLFTTPEGYVSAGAPYGGSVFEQKMFDELTYFNKKVYNGKFVADVIDRVRDFIRKYKKEHGKN